MNKLIIGALFDDDTSSYNKCVRERFNDKFQAFSFGINKQAIHYHLNISMLNADLIKTLENFPLPDIILASPPCKSFSTMETSGRMSMSYKNMIGKIKNSDYYDEYNKTCYKTQKRYFFQKEVSRINGEATTGAMMQIIKHFKPKIGVIENPQSSKMGEFLEEHGNVKGIKNLAYYNAYNPLFSKKPTIFLSNMYLELRKAHAKGDKNRLRDGNYSTRCEIPQELVQHILELILKGINE